MRQREVENAIERGRENDRGQRDRGKEEPERLKTQIKRDIERKRGRKGERESHPWQQLPSCCGGSQPAQRERITLSATCQDASRLPYSALGARYEVTGPTHTKAPHCTMGNLPWGEGRLDGPLCGGGTTQMCRDAYTHTLTNIRSAFVIQRIQKERKGLQSHFPE